MNKIVLAVVGFVGLMGLAGMILSWPSSTPRPPRSADPVSEPVPEAAAKPDPEPAPDREWFEGGTLHQSTSADWLASTDPDRLATAADLATAMMNDAERKFQSPESMRAQAEELVRCITAGAESAADASVPALSAECRDVVIPDE